MSKIWGKLSKALWVLLFAFITVALAAILPQVLPPDALRNLQSTLDSFWWKASLIRWLILAVIIVQILPWYIQKRLSRLSDKLEGLYAEYERAQAQSASYETLSHYEYLIHDNSKLHSAISKIQQHYRWVAVGLVSIELLAVQLPHLDVVPSLNAIGETLSSGSDWIRGLF